MVECPHQWEKQGIYSEEITPPTYGTAYPRTVYRWFIFVFCPKCLTLRRIDAE